LEVTAPHAVFREIRQYADEASRRLEKARQSWLKAQEVTETSLVKVLLADLDEGEAEVIALALKPMQETLVRCPIRSGRRCRRDLTPRPPLPSPSLPPGEGAPPPGNVGA
jgi:predicted nucleic acid-binding protein